MVEETTTPDERVPINIQDEMRRSYMEYAMSVIIGRALPDVRDGLKPVHRRSLYAMYDLKNFYNQAYKSPWLIRRLIAVAASRTLQTTSGGSIRRPTTRKSQTKNIASAASAIAVNSILPRNNIHV